MNVKFYDVIIWDAHPALPHKKVFTFGLDRGAPFVWDLAVAWGQYWIDRYPEDMVMIHELEIETWEASAKRIDEQLWRRLNKKAEEQRAATAKIGQTQGRLFIVNGDGPVPLGHLDGVVVADLQAGVGTGRVYFHNAQIQTPRRSGVTHFQQIVRELYSDTYQGEINDAE